MQIPLQNPKNPKNLKDTSKNSSKTIVKSKKSKKSKNIYRCQGAAGPAEELQGENARYDRDSVADGRLAFYVNGKFGDDWRLTASADTREGPVEDLFSNFLDKSPVSLFRRIDKRLGAWTKGSSLCIANEVVSLPCKIPVVARWIVDS